MTKPVILIDHSMSAIFGGKVVHWTYKGPVYMKRPDQRIYWVPYTYPRENTRNSRSKEMRDDYKFRRRKRAIVEWLKVDRDTRRTNWFKHNVDIRNNFQDSSYRNRWY